MTLFTSILMPNAIIWNLSPELFTKGFFCLRWYNLLFTAGLLGGLPIWYHMFDKAGKTRKEADQIKTYIILSVIVGARLGHVIFYEWNYYKKHLLKIFLPVVFSPTFKITGFEGLASHGAFIGIILAIFLYIKQLKISIFPPRIYFKNSRPSGEFLWILDHLALIAPLGCALIRIGNFTNSEIIGKPTGSKYGVIFVRNLHDDLCQQHASIIQNLVIRKASTTNTLPIKPNYQPIELTITFKEKITDEKIIRNFLEQSLKKQLVQASYYSESPKVYEPYGRPLSYTLQKQNGGYKASLYTWGIPRHPAQLYESFSYFLIFIILFLWWRQKGQTLAPGRIFGSFMTLAFSFRFFYEFYKENQIAFESTMWLNMGQLLSLPAILAGLFLILRRTVKVEPKEKLNT